MTNEFDIPRKEICQVGQFSIAPWVQQQYVEHHGENTTDYSEIRDMLNMVRGYFLAANRDKQRQMLKKAYVYAVATIRCRTKFADETYARWLAGDSLETAFRETSNIDGKAAIQERTLDHFEERAKPVLDAVNDGNFIEAAEIINDDDDWLWVRKAKGHFTIALLTGKTVCIDSNVQEGLFGDEMKGDIEWTHGEYDHIQDAINRIVDEYDDMPFLPQWVTYDVHSAADKDVEHHHTFYNSLDMT